MPIDKKIVTKLLDQLKDYIYYIEGMNFSQHALHDDVDIQHLLSHRLHVAVEICTDIAMHIAAAMELPGRNSASDVIKLLGKQGVLDKRFAAKFQAAPKLRNLLIHGYDNVDYTQLFHDYKNDLQDLKEFARQIKTYLDKLSRKK